MTTVSVNPCSMEARDASLVLVSHEDVDYGYLIVNVHSQLVAVDKQLIGGVFLGGSSPASLLCHLPSAFPVPGAPSAQEHHALSGFRNLPIAHRQILQGSSVALQPQHLGGVP